MLLRRLLLTLALLVGSIGAAATTAAVTATPAHAACVTLPGEVNYRGIDYRHGFYLGIWVRSYQCGWVAYVPFVVWATHRPGCWYP